MLINISIIDLVTSKSGDRMKLKDLWHKSQFKNYFVAKKQREYLKEHNISDCTRMIIFLAPSDDKVNGGILSIASLAEETAKLTNVHKSNVFVCTRPGEPLLFQYTKFKNTIKLVELNMLISKINNNCKVLLHIPELYVDKISKKIKTICNYNPHVDWRFNVLLQNIDLVPQKSSIELLQNYGKVTCTTAHIAYCNNETETLLGCPVHHFSAWGSPEKYIYKSYDKKENIIILSPDKHPNRQEVIDVLKSKMKNYTFKIISKMTYEEYKALIARAKFSVTFGEGLDGYFGELVYSGGIGSAVYNDRFFTDEYKSLPFIYPSWDEFIVRFPEDAFAVDNKDDYVATHMKQFNTLSMQYTHDKYVANLIRYYEQSGIFC